MGGNSDSLSSEVFSISRPRSPEGVRTPGRRSGKLTAATPGPAVCAWSSQRLSEKSGFLTAAPLDQRLVDSQKASRELCSPQQPSLGVFWLLNVLDCPAA